MKAEYPASVICYRAKFDDFKKSSSGRIRNLPAEINDDFAVLASVGQKGSIGFDKSKEGAAALKSLISNCYYIDIDGKNFSPPQAKNFITCHFLYLEIKMGSSSAQ
jgi:hypothetical protein